MKESVNTKLYNMKEIKMKATEAIEVNIDQLFANDYNPNRMPDTEMSLLADCIQKYGFLFPIIATYNKAKSEEVGKTMYRIIDGYHRFETLKRIGSKKACIVDLQLTHEDAVQLTVLMNRIKGMHQVELMSELVVKLHDLGLEDEEIIGNLGMETEEYIRLKQQLGIAHTFRKHQYMNSWTIDKDSYGLKNEQ